jgi:hypothetical protein
LEKVTNSYEPVHAKAARRPSRDEGFAFVARARILAEASSGMNRDRYGSKPKPEADE